MTLNKNGSYPFIQYLGYERYTLNTLGKEYTINQIGATNPNADTRNADIASPKENSWRRTQGSMKVASPGLHEETQ